jgi:hypothetical protein
MENLATDIKQERKGNKSFYGKSILIKKNGTE